MKEESKFGNPPDYKVMGEIKIQRSLWNPMYSFLTQFY